ncbi:hypothetical protein PsorP6_007660 [Peronosclerospora sorghi]|uniref:Uncharacterized protein n=1 Tax=Peronosclerospora sorghi TaxID=230839 RepID=A0ACC0W7R4_9STRA|nr:hypothetical protein PsorP6_007660 [Peronosclerospora sorghi]
MDATYKKNRYPHFGTAATLRGEGNHYVMKQYLKIENADLLMVQNRLKLMLNTQFVEEQKMEFDKVSVAHNHAAWYMKDILGKVSNFALQKLADQGKAALKVPTDEECSGMFECTWILTCKHIISRKIDSGKGIELSDIGQQWWLECDSAVADSSDEEAAVELSPRSTALEICRKILYSAEPSAVPVVKARREEMAVVMGPQLQNPVPVTRKRGRPARSRNKVNKRKKSGFEYVESRKCGNFGQRGHKSRTCTS